MMGHLSERTMADLLEAEGTPKQYEHLASCEACRARLENARAALDVASRVEVPEPPGLYWEALRRNVSRRIAEEPERPARWSWLVPLAALTAAVVVIAVSLVERPAPGGVAPVLPAWSALPSVQDDDDLAVVSGFTVEEGVPTTWEEGRGLVAFVATLSDEESEALVEALHAEQPEGGL